MFHNRSVDVHQFAMVPRADVPRSRFDMQHTHKTTFDAGYLVPVYVDEVLPGDSFHVQMTALARLATPIFPIMDNLFLESFFFFVPNRLTWANWQKFMGEQDNPADSISFAVPQASAPVSGVGWPIGSVGDYFGLGTVGSTFGGTGPVNALPLRAYNLIYNKWFRDENLQNSVPQLTDDGPDASTNYVLLRRGKRHDYFTSCLPWPQKGGVAITLPLGTSAPVNPSSAHAQPTFWDSTTGTSAGRLGRASGAAGAGVTIEIGGGATEFLGWNSPGLVADLSAATAATINQLRQSFQIQKLLERDARGGTRYTEIVRSHFGVVSPDARLQRPEYLGGGSSPVVVSPIAQTSGTNITGGTTPQGNLAAIGVSVARGHGFSASFTEHGYVIGLVCVRADLTYQQGLRRMWSRSTRYDFYWPVFAMLGEQAVLNKEIYFQGSAGAGVDDQVFGYQERWAEYRYNPSMVTGLFRSTAAGTLDGWHLAQKFTSVPVLNTTFIQETPPVSRVVAVGAGANGAQFIFDSFFSVRAARPMPMYSVPGLIDHF